MVLVVVVAAVVVVVVVMVAMAMAMAVGFRGVSASDQPTGQHWSSMECEIIQFSRRFGTTATRALLAMFETI